MAIKAVAIDDTGTRHLVIGLNRENMNTLLNGNILILPTGYLAGLTEDGYVVLMFAETEKGVLKMFPPALRPP